MIMLYQLHELTRSFLTPMASFTQIGSNLFTNPFSPYTYLPLSKNIAAGFELFHRLGKDYEKPEWNIDTVMVDDKKSTITITTTRAKPFCNLIHFEREHSKNPGGDPKVLIVAPLSGHHATLLRDTVKTMLTSFDVYITDWVDARMVPPSKGPFHLDDYVDYVREFIHVVGPDMHIMSVCQPTVPVLAAVSLMASAGEHDAMPKSMIMMGGPIDTRLSPTQVNSLADSNPFSWFENKLIHVVPGRYPGAGRKVYPGFLQHAGFVAMNPDKHMEAHYDFYMNLMSDQLSEAEHHRRFYDEYNAVLDLPAEYYLDTIRIVFQDHLLPKGEWKVHNELVKPQDITQTRLLTIEGENDDITGYGQTEAAQKLCSGLKKEDRKHFLAKGCGHYGIFSGSKWRKQIFPVVEAFIAETEEKSVSQAVAVA
jgi:poly(3-hydroxybutyrate) depolymerase